MYSLRLNSFGQTVVDRIDNDVTTTGFGMFSDNSDYQKFKNDLANGAELKDADGNLMTADAIKTFLEGLA
jgi:hypothetical protein